MRMELYAVSYTHLDVYKRQGLGCRGVDGHTATARRNRADHVDEIVRVSAYTVIESDRGARANGRSRGRVAIDHRHGPCRRGRGIVTAVSYTHLDVYKRQALSLPKGLAAETGETTRPRAGAPFAELKLSQVMRDVMVVPETKSVLDLIRDFQQRRRHMAIVVDEYGSTVGLVTAEDAIEQLTGCLLYTSHRPQSKYC